MNIHSIYKKLKIEKSYINFLIISMLMGILIYLTLISNQLTNHYDGLWCDPYFAAGR